MLLRSANSRASSALSATSMQRVRQGQVCLTTAWNSSTIRRWTRLRLRLSARWPATPCNCWDLIAGVSYYKAGVPLPGIRIEGAGIDGQTARFRDALYLHGLGDLPITTSWTCANASAFRQSPCALRRRLRVVCRAAPWCRSAVRIHW